jgi:hypothetical protein
MTSTFPVARPPAGPAPTPHFHRTVDRSLVHRDALSEVFLTDCCPTGRDSYVAAAQIPSSHAYFGDALGTRDLADALLLVECARQAETAGGHLVFGIEHGRRFVLLDWSLRLAAPGMAVRAGRPAELVIAVEGREVKRTGDLVHGLVFAMALSRGGVPVGEVRMRVGYLRDEAYDLVRLRHRAGPPPTSVAVRPDPGGTPVAPHLVGRADPANVVLLDARSAYGELTARVRLAVEHPSLYDHAQDHVPGMVLLEAGRQAGLLALHDLAGADPTTHALTGFETAFSRFAELDAPVLVRVRPRVGRPGDDHELDVAFLQDGHVTAEGSMTFSPVSPARRDR